MPAVKRGLRHVPYDELCKAVPLSEVVASPGHAICRIAQAAAVQPAVPTDLGGLVAPDGRSGRGPSYVPETWWTRPFVTPDLYIAGLNHVTCVGGRVRRIAGGWHDFGQLMVVDGRHLVDDSFHVRDRSRSLPQDLVQATEDGLGLVTELRDAWEVPGVSLLIGSTYGHFGHFLMEGLSRLWALELLPAEGLRFVVYEPELTEWQRSVMRAAGVNTDAIVHVTRPTRFERLIVPARAFNLHQASSPEQDRTWARIGDQFEDGRSGDWIYLSRSRFPKNRTLLNEAHLERVFAERGFQIVHPQEIAIEEQIALCRGADRIAGNSGSAMYLAAFQRRDGDLLVAAPRGFAFRDDQLIAHYRGARLAYLMGDTDPEQADAPPRKAAWSIDPSRLDGALDRWLGQEPDVEQVSAIETSPAVAGAMDLPPPIFVGGTGRSGTTILGQALGEHREYALIPVEAKFHCEPLGVPGLLSQRFTLEDVVRHLREEWDPARTPRTGLAAVIEEGLLRQSLDGFVQTAQADPLAAGRALISQVFAGYAKSRRKSGWVEMTPRNAVAAPALNRLFPNMKLVHVVRDGRDVAASLVNLGWKQDPFDALIWWERRIGQCFAATESLSEGSHCVVAFDDLMSHRRSDTLERLFDFLGWSSPAEVLAFMEQRVKPDRAHVGRWRDDFDEETKKRLDAEYDAALSRLQARWSTAGLALPNAPV